MSAVYLETSAILRWLFNEPGVASVLREVARAKPVVSSVLTLLETERAVTRAEGLRVLSPADSQKLRGMIAKSRNGWVLMEISAEVRTRAAQAFPVEPVRTLDAVHLATALAFLKAYPDLKVLSFDDRVVSNARALGISVSR